MKNYSTNYPTRMLVAVVAVITALAFILPAVTSAQGVPSASPSNGETSTSAPAAAPSNSEVAAPATAPSNGETTAPAASPSNGSTGPGIVPPPASPSNGSTGPGIVTPPPTSPSNGEVTPTTPPAASPSNGATGPGTVPAASPSNGAEQPSGTTPAASPSNGAVSTGAPAASPSNGAVTPATTPTNPPTTSGGGGFYANGPIAPQAGTPGGVTNPNNGGIIPIPGTCSFIGSRILIGENNNALAVLNLQKFLNQYEGAVLATTGIYDKATIDAVKTFQAKYASDILAPWGITNPTGQIFITTKNKIDEIFCKVAKINLTDEEKAIIASFRNGSNQPSIGTPSVETPSNGTSTPAPVVGKKNVFQNAASAILAVPKAVVNFFKRLF